MVSPRYPQQVGNVSVAVGLLDHPVAGIDQDDGCIGCGSTCDHIPCILDVAGGVGNDEFTVGGGKITVSDIDGDTLLFFLALI